ncbi:MAG: zinc-dependent peptidase [Rhodocyclaceae bacterium]|nr:zinc-dependent peptidase [Rhodocyclaceae bacterium]
MIKAVRDWLRRRMADGVRVEEPLWRRVEEGHDFLAALKADDRSRLRDMASRFIAEKEWSGAQGLVLRPEIQVSIALQACLPVLNLGLEFYRGWVGIVVYPGDFVIPRRVTDEHGIVHEYDDAVLGEAWEGGPVILSWFDDQDEAWGINVVIHEFAHKLDMLNGVADGCPPLHAGMSREAWKADFGSAFEDFQRRVDAGDDTMLDPYGAESPAEFFAVMSEAFFETPELLQSDYPAVYGQLSRFYRQDPGR